MLGSALAEPFESGVPSAALRNVTDPAHRGRSFTFVDAAAGAAGPSGAARPAGRGKKAAAAASSAVTDPADTWSSAEVRTLLSAHRLGVPSDPDFWHKVRTRAACVLRTRSLSPSRPPALRDYSRCFCFFSFLPFLPSFLSHVPFSFSQWPFTF